MLSLAEALIAGLQCDWFASCHRVQNEISLACFYSESCPPPEVGVITSDFQLTQHFDSYPGCTTVSGSVLIGHLNCSSACTVTSLAPLANLVLIEGSLRIQCCHALTSIDGLTRLREATGSLAVYYNRELLTLSGLTSLQTVGGSLTIAQNPKLSLVSGFSALRVINGYLAIEHNVALTSLGGFRQLELIRGFEVSSGHALTVVFNTELTDLTGLSGIANMSYGTVRIEGNSRLCYAGYPLWSVGEYPIRLQDPESDKGIDWRTKMSGVEPWQYTWGLVDEGFPTLTIRDNAPAGSCGEPS